MLAKLFLLLLAGASASGLVAQGTPASQSVVDVSKSVRFAWSLDAGQLTYSVSRLAGARETEVLGRSPLGLKRSDTDFTGGLTFVAAAPARTIDETYTLLAGKRHEIHNRATEQSFTFKNRDGAVLELTVRAMDDGVAFRYGFPAAPGTAAAKLLLVGESTGFQLPAKGEAWMLPYDKIAECSPSYESPWQNRIAIGQTVGDFYAGWAFPALFHAANHWILITEANLDGTCYAAHLQPTAPGGLYSIRLPEDEETYGVAVKEATISLPWQSPWRVVVVGDTPATILETDIVTDLSAPNELADISWIKPGRSSWSWWSDKGSPSDYNRLVPFIDLSADFGWEYSLIDAGWESMYNGTVEKLLDYAKSKNVGLVLWYNSGGPHSKVICGLRDFMHIPEKREAEFERIAKLGVKGVKVDFMQSDKQYIIQLYIDILRAAARHHLFVDFHGATTPRGWARTFPNLVSQEGIRGVEQYWDADFAENAQTFHTIYPFTRNVVGSMDYTPVVFGGCGDLQWHKTTNAHELALSVAFESGVQHYVDSVAAYRAQSEQVRKVLAQVPSTWDETRYVAGTPGELCVLARRTGRIWYLAALNGRIEAQAVEASLAFLGKGRFTADLFTDGSWQKEIKQETRPVNGGDTLPLALAARGGALVRFTPAP